MREVIVFSYGDARDPQTWSNVPYCATKALEKKGWIVHYENIGPQNRVERILRNLYNKCSRLIRGKSTLILAEQSLAVRRKNRHIVKKAAERFPNSDLMLFFSYSVNGNGLTCIPSVLFCDFTIEYAISNIYRREPTVLEKKLIRSQDEIIKSSELVISLFPNATKHYRQYYHGNENFYGISGHIINCLTELPPKEMAIAKKYESTRIVFVGRRKYKKAALTLLEAVRDYNAAHEQKLTVDVIGMSANELGVEYGDISEMHGVLNKGNELDKHKYYSIIMQAKCVVNTSANWAGISSIVESMWLYTPAITSAYKDFVDIFGEDISFGKYCEAENEEDLRKTLEWLFQQKTTEYEKMCNEANAAVESFTWDNCIGKVIDEWNLRGLIK